VDAEERAKIIELLEGMLAADEVVTDEERQFLRRVVERFGLPSQGAPACGDENQKHGDRLVPSVPGRATTILRELSPELQGKAMVLLIEAAVVDGKIAPEEHALLLASAAALGIDACALEERIARRLKSSPPE